MIKFTNVVKKYKDDIILDNISFEITKPGLYIFNGVNGSGKSTILKLILNIIYKTSGEIESNYTYSYLPDKYKMPSLINSYDYINMLSTSSKSNLYIRAFDLPNKKIMNLSKGNFAKLGIIQILSNDKECYIFDEPLDGLDSKSIDIFKSFISEMLQSKVIIMSLHDNSKFLSLLPKIYLVKDGKLYEKK